jgi:outer membrane protein assembly factor BamA
LVQILKSIKKVIENLSKVKEFETLRSKKHNKAVVAIEENDVVAKKSFSNFSNIHTDELRNINPMQLLKYKYLIIENPKKSLEALTKKIEK